MLENKNKMIKSQEINIFLIFCEQVLFEQKDWLGKFLD